MLSSIRNVKFILKTSKLNMCITAFYMFYFLSRYDDPRTKVFTHLDQTNQVLHVSNLLKF